MVGLDTADLSRNVAVAAGLGDDQLMHPAPVVFGCQEKVGSLLGGELQKAGGGVEFICFDTHTV